MLAKLTSKNQLTLPKSVTDRLGPVQYFEVQLQAGQVLLTPVRIQRGDAVRAKLAELDLGDAVMEAALSFAIQPALTATPKQRAGHSASAPKAAAKPAPKRRKAA
ncbi:MAG: AbrB/MazE/SpoVT family DNA-binding domain-containing protein [Burkholderiaceae bacterium]